MICIWTITVVPKDKFHRSYNIKYPTHVTHLLKNHSGDWSQTWLIHSLWYGPATNFWWLMLSKFGHTSHSAEIRSYAPLWFVEQFPHFYGEPLMGLKSTQGLPPAWLTCGHAQLDSRRFLDSDLSNSFRAFADESMIGFIIIVLPWPGDCFTVEKVSSFLFEG